MSDHEEAYRVMWDCIIEGRVEEAMVVLDDAFGRVADLTRLEATRALALKRVYGPDWPRVYVGWP